MPKAVYVGIGGIGASIAANVRRELSRRAAMDGDTPFTSDQLDHYQFLIVDTWKDHNARSFAPHEVFVIPRSIDSVQIDQRLRDYWNRDPFFKEWWPATDHDQPVMVHSDIFGRGDRLQGKLAYRISLDSGTAVVDGIGQAALQIQGVLSNAPEVGAIPIYLIASLGGGTGSGIVLALAQHLRQSLPSNCALIGVFPLGSIVRLAFEERSTHFLANTDVALREIDYCQRAEFVETLDLNPFLRWQTGEISGQRRAPFDNCYLFGDQGSDGPQLSTLDEYERIIADCLLIDSAVHHHWHGARDTWAWSTASDKRSLSYASPGTVSLVYPGEWIELYLSRQFAIGVVDYILGLSAKETLSKAEQFISQQGLEWDESALFRGRFLQPAEWEGRLLPLTEFSGFETLDDQRYQSGGRNETLEYVKSMRRDFDRYVSSQYRPHLLCHLPRVVDDYEAALRRIVEETLVKQEKGALSSAEIIVSHLVWHLRAMQEDTQSGVSIVGHRLTMLHERWATSVIRLGYGFGRLRNRKGRHAKRTFYLESWIPFRDTTLEFERLQVYRTAYQEMADRTEQVARELESIALTLRQNREDLVRLTHKHPAQESMADALDWIVLGDSRSIVHRFRHVLDRFTMAETRSCARHLVARRVAQTDGSQVPPSREGLVLDAIRNQSQVESAESTDISRWDDLVRDAMAWAKELIGSEVISLSIWDALVAEYEASVSEGNSAPMETGSWDISALERFVYVRLLQLSTVPTGRWGVEGDSIENFKILALNEAAYTQAASKYDLHQVLMLAPIGMQGLEGIVGIPGRDRITIYRYHGAFPLSALSSDELTAMAEATQLRHTSARYTDRRFEKAVDKTITDPRDAEA